MFYPVDDHDDEMVEPQITHEEIALCTTLQTVCNQYAIPVNLDALNAAHARAFVENIQQPEPFHINNWLTSYKQALLEKIKTQLMDTKPNALFPATTIKNTAIESYSYLFHMSLIQDNKESFARFFTKLGDAHAFIQATGFSTQNETSYLAWLDLYNYWRSADYIAETKFTFASLMQPIEPILAEYHDIAHRETSNSRKILRTLMPLLVLAATIILVSALLSAIVIPEIAFIFILIPTVYLGLILATNYVTTKDYIYHEMRKRYYQGQFEVPEFMYNERLIKGFNSVNSEGLIGPIQHKGRQIRQFYIDEIRVCYEKEAGYQQLTQNTLSSDEINDRRKNNLRRRTLQLEWYDIHCNPKLGCDKIMPIAMERLRLDGHDACVAIQNELNSHPEKISAFVETVIDAIKTRIEEVAPAPNVQQHRFFLPLCFKQKEKSERLRAMMDDIQPFAP